VSISESEIDDHKLGPEVKEVHRLEVITGTDRRRQFTEDFKAR
jgi:hypothetical protein